MAKVKTAYVCSDCGADFMRWQGQCTECGAWNTISEVRLGTASSKNNRFEGYAGAAMAKVIRLDEVDLQDVPRFSSGFAEFDRVLGGGIVPGSAILIGGHPGAGKSTLLLQIMCGLAQHSSALYVTGEESLQQVAMRAQRLGLPTDGLKMLAETNVETICQLAQQEKPRIMVIDSIQVMHLADIQSAPGSVSQVRESAAFLTRFAKQHHIAIIMVGHVTKDGSLAGPKVLEH
ncbi:MAG: AAA family ATPase, partial [Rheinheimera sp.]|nr:AAA family ATPase [Rheinheimera sp.]